MDPGNTTNPLYNTTTSSNAYNMSALDTGAAAGDGSRSIHTNDHHRNYTDHYDTYYDFYEDCGLETIPTFREYKAAEVVITVLYPLLLVLGTLGNGVSVVVLSHLSEQAWSSCLYMAVLSVVELVVLYIRCGGTWFLKQPGGG